MGHALGQSLRSYEVQLHRVGCSLFRRVHAVLVSRGRRVAVSAMAGHGRPWYRHWGLPGLGPAPATRGRIRFIFSDFIQHFCSSSPTPSSKHIINEYDLKHLSKQLHRAIRYTPYLLSSMPMRAVVHTPDTAHLSAWMLEGRRLDGGGRGWSQFRSQYR